MKLSKISARVLLNYFNKAKTPEEMRRLISDDPEYGAVGYGMTLPTARAALAFRRSLPRKKFKDPQDLLKVKGIGKDTYHDIIKSFANLPAKLKATIIFNTERSAGSIKAIMGDDLGFSAGRAEGIKLTIIKNILTYRRSLEGGRFTRFEEIKNAAGVGESTLRTIEENFIEAAPLGGGVQKQMLANELKVYLAPDDKTAMILGTDTAARALEKLSRVLEKGKYQYLNGLYQEARMSQVITGQERVAEIVYFPQVASSVRLSPPLDIIDPASLPDVAIDYRWFRTGLGLYLTPVNGLAMIEALTESAWTRVLSVDHSVFIEPLENGIRLRKTSEGPLGAFGIDAVLSEAAQALRVTCRGGVGGLLLGDPYPLGLDDSRPAVPLDWGHPKTDVWINPLAHAPWVSPHPKGPSGFLPGGVIIAGGLFPPQADAQVGPREETPSVLIGTRPGITLDGSPWPPEWPWPYPLQPGGEDEQEEGFPGGGDPVIFGGLDIDVELDVNIKGCQCIRRPQVSEYAGQPSEEGGDYEWEVEDDKIIEIQGPKNQKKVKIKSKDIGKSDLILHYTKSGRKAKTVKGIFVIYQKFTEKDKPRSERLAMAVAQPSTKVRINKRERPRHKHVDTDIQRHRAQFELSFKGQLKDALIDIKDVEVLAGEDFRVRLSASGNEYGTFDNDTFEVYKCVVYGPGRTYVRVKASNNIRFWGTDTLEVVIRISNNWEGILSRLEEARAHLIKYGATPAQLADADNRLQRAWESALLNVELEYAWLTHTDNTVKKVPGGEKFSVAAEDDKKNERIDIKTSIESKTVDLQEKSKKLLAPKNKPKNYFLLHHKYEGSDLQWDNEGRLLAEPGTPVSLIYLDPCCAHKGPAVGVEMEPPGVVIIEGDSGVSLKAKGQPTQWQGVSGIYEWFCIAYPDGAVFEFKPDGPTPGETVEFFTDTPGVYTFKVIYRLLDAVGSWTYALGDAQIVFAIAAKTYVERAGDYSRDGLGDYLHIPYYRERTVQEQPGAGLMVVNAKGGPLGKDFLIRLNCDPDAAFANPPIGVAFYANGDKREFQFRLDAATKSRASLKLHSALVIEKLHIVNIQYRDLPKLKRDAVLVEAIVKPLAPPIIDLMPAPAPGASGQPPVGSGVSVVSDTGNDPRNIFVEGEEPEFVNPVVNLILRTRDMGNAAASNATVGLSGHEQVNLTTGNQNFQLAFWESTGVGQNLSPFVSYNSKDATREEAVQFYGKNNGVNKEGLAKQFGESHGGFGWSSVFDMAIFEFIDVEGDPLNPRLLKCAEVRLADGNRIVFKEEFTNEYHVRSPAETLGDQPGEALGLVLTKIPNDNQWRLEDMNRTAWVFDQQGRLIKIHDAREQGANRRLDPVQLNWSAGECLITDSARRVTKIAFNSQGLFKTIEAPNGAKFIFTYKGHVLEKIQIPLSIAWSFGYAEQSLMTLITPPEGHPVSFDHYSGGSVEGIPTAIAEHYTGRVVNIQFGLRKFIIKYDRRVPETQEQSLVCVTPLQHQWRYFYDPVSQAAKRVEYAESGNSSFKPFAAYLYDQGSKLIRRKDDLHKGSSDHFHGFSPHGNGRRMLSSVSATGVRQRYRFNREDLLEKHTDGENQDVSYHYYPDRQIKRVDYPRLPSRSVTLANRTARPFEEYTYDEKGRVKTYRDTDGIVTTYEYGGPRDPQNTGNPTTITVGRQSQKLTWDKMGWLKQTESHYGHKVINDYDQLGRIKETKYGDYSLTNTYDLLHRKRETRDSLGRISSTEYDEYSQVKSVSNAMGDKREFPEYDKEGNLLKQINEDGGVFEFKNYDALGRYATEVPPDVEDLPSGHNGLFSSKMPNTKVEYDDEAAVLSYTGEPAYSIKRTSGAVIRTTYFNLSGQKVAEEQSIGAALKASVFEYDQRGQQTKTIGYKGNQRFGVIDLRVTDILGRVIRRSDGSNTIETYYGRDNQGNYVLELYPAQDRQSGRRPSTVKRFDDNGREIAEFDGLGEKIKEKRFNDTANVCEVFGVEPGGNSSNLIKIETLKYNEFGKVAEQTNHLSDITAKYNYDDLSRLKSAEANNGTTAYTYDELDRVKEIKSALPVAGGGVGVSGPNALSPSTTMKEVIVKHEYDKMGRIKLKGTAGAREQYKYDLLGRLSEFTRTGLGGVGSLTEKYFYNAKGERKAGWIAPDIYTTYRYDHQQLKETETLRTKGLTWQEIKKHDLFGNVTELQTSWHDFVFECEHDSSGRMTRYKTRKGSRDISDVRINFDGASMPNDLRLTYGGRSRDVFLKYDGNLQAKEIEDRDLSSGGNYAIHYNTFGSRKSLERPGDDKAKTTWAYHANGRLKEVKHLFGDGFNDSFTSAIAQSDYDVLGNPTRITHEYLKDGAKTVHPNFLESEEHRYDQANRLISSTFKGSRAGLFTKTFGDWGVYFRFLYPVPGNLFALLYSDTGAMVQQDYYFDEYNRKTLEFTRLTPDLDQPDEKQVVIHRVRYGAGQAVEEEIREWYDVGQTTPKYIRKKFLFDEHGRRSHEIETLRQTGSNAKAWAFMTEHVYGLDDKPVRTNVYELRGSRRHWIREERFCYGPDSQMIWSRHRSFDESKLADDDAISNLSGSYAELGDFDNALVAPTQAVQKEDEFYYVYAGVNLVALLDKDARLIQEYLNEEGANTRLSFRNGHSGTVYDYYNNYLGTTLLATEPDGDVHERFPQSGSYGESLKKVPAAVHAGMWANLTSFLQTPSRNFDAATGQFMSPDPIGLAGGINLYSFAENNPVSLKDPSGRYWETAWDIASLSLGWLSFRKNVEEGNFWLATLDAVGIVIDAIALVLPVPGGFGAAKDAVVQGNRARRAVQRAKQGFEAYRLARETKRGYNILQAAERTASMIQSVHQLSEAYKKRDRTSALLNLFIFVIGVQKWGSVFMGQKGIRDAFNNLADYRDLPLDLQRLYRKGQTALTDHNFQALERAAKKYFKEYDSLLPFNQTIIRGAVYDDLAKNFSKWDAVKNWRMAWHPKILQTGPTPDALGTIGFISWSAAALSGSYAVYRTATDHNDLTYYKDRYYQMAQ